MEREQQEYAPQYSLRERIAAFVAIALWGSQQPRQILEEAKPKNDATCSDVASLDGEAMRKGTLSAGDTR